MGALDEVEVPVGVDVTECQHGAEDGPGMPGWAERAGHTTRETGRPAAVEAEPFRADHQVAEAVAVQVAGDERGRERNTAGAEGEPAHPLAGQPAAGPAQQEQHALAR